MDQLGMTEAQRKATLRDGQDAGEMLLDIEARIGELYDSLPKSAGGSKTARSADLKGKQESIRDAGIADRSARKSSEVFHNPVIVAKIKAQRGDLLPGRRLTRRRAIVQPGRI